jgi:solute carrier family 39 (zinc transporter), member 9
VGTSLIVIIPEGVETLYSASLTGSAHVKRTPGGWLPLEGFGNAAALDKRDASDPDDSLMSGPALPNSPEVSPPTPTISGTVGVPEHEGHEKDNADESEKRMGAEHQHDSPHAWIGVALISGFVLMYLIDKLPQYTSKSTAQPYHISLNDLGRGLQREPSPNNVTEANEFLPNSGLDQAQGRGFATTTGLVIHAAADGIALGASSPSVNTSLTFVIFLAIMLHKAPAAFGLTSVLLKQGLSKRTARAHLLLFSLAAPTGAMLTWLVAHTLNPEQTGDAQNTRWWTGMLLLFSGGTFLYVAMHTMQDVGGSHDVHMNGHVHGIGEDRGMQPQPQRPPPLDLIATILGMILPLFLQIGHAH